MRRKILGTFLRVSLLLVVLAGCAQGQSSGKHKATAPLEKTEWKLIWLNGTKIDVAAPLQVPYIQLDPESHRVSGSGGCNRLMGGYELSGDHLKFTQMAITRMACLHGGDTESNFTKALDQVTSWKIVGDKLLLIDANQHVLAKLSGVTPEA
jgi:heat shock protein HslJ